VIIAWLVAQVLQLVFDSFGTPEWVMKTVLVLLATGVPLVLFFAWAFEMTPEGLKREIEVDRSQSITRETGHKLNNAIVVVLVVGLGYFAYDKFVLSAGRELAAIETAVEEATLKAEIAPAASKLETTTEPDKSIAVLPFVNMSGDQENEYFSDGLTEELLNSLARIKELKVTGRTSSFAFKNRNNDLREIGKALGVAHILEGSVRKAQNRVRITAQLIKVEDGYHLWSDSYNRELDDIFAIQEEIATRVAAELTSTLLGDTTGPLVHLGTSNTQAYEAFLRGRYLFVRTPDDIQVQNEAEQLFKRALELDPQFTLAWYGQFGVLSFRHRAGTIGYQEGAAQLRELADRMIIMDPDLPESHVAAGRAALVEMKWPESEAAYRQALKLTPGNINALGGLAGLMTLLNRHAEGLEIALKALSRDPLDLQALSSAMSAYGLLGQCAEAGDITMRVLSLAPGVGRFRGRLGRCWLVHHGDYEKAIDLFEREPVAFVKLTGLAIAQNKLGQQDNAQQYLDKLIAAEGERASYQYAQIYAQWGETEKALDALEHAWEIRDTGFVLINMDSYLNPLRDHPRFIALLEIWKDPSRR